MYKVEKVTCIYFIVLCVAVQSPLSRLIQKKPGTVNKNTTIFQLPVSRINPRTVTNKENDIPIQGQFYKLNISISCTFNNYSGNS